MYVSDDFRTNDLSKIPGGSVVTVNFSNKKPLKYDKIKSARLYANKIIKEFDSILSITDNQNNTWYQK
jgi:hypothetical protein